MELALLDVHTHSFSQQTWEVDVNPVSTDDQRLASCQSDGAGVFLANMAVTLAIDFHGASPFCVDMVTDLDETETDEVMRILGGDDSGG